MTSIEALCKVREKIEAERIRAVKERDQYSVEGHALQAHSYDMRQIGLEQAILIIDRMIREEHRIGMDWTNCRWEFPPTQDEINAFFADIIVGWDDLAKEIAEETGMPWKAHLDEAYDMLDELKAFAQMWDMCAVSQGHP